MRRIRIIMNQADRIIKVLLQAGQDDRLVFV